MKYLLKMNFVNSLNKPMINVKYMYVGIEISTVCNAKCPWCFTTKVTEEKSSDLGKAFMSMDTFMSVIDRLETLGLLHKDVIFNLYEIGESFLNKDLSKIFNFLNKKSLKYAISTNASIPVLFEEGSDILKNLSSFIISIPGFSQESYDRVHGLRFDRIRENIITLITNFRKCGFKGDARLVYHVYQFNINEIYKAKAFAEENNIDLYPYYAILYEWRHLRDYLSDTLPYGLLKKASKEIFLGNIEKTISIRMPDFICEFFNMLLIDVNGDLKTCCQIRKGDPGYSYGNIFDLSTEEIIARRTTQPICKECQSRGMDYYLSVYTPFNLCSSDLSQFGENCTYKNLVKLLQDNAEKQIVLFGAGKFGTKALKSLTSGNIMVNFFADNSPLKIGKQICGVEVVTPSDILNRCKSPLVVITTINHRQVMEQLFQLGIKSVYYFPIDVYPY